MNSATSKKRLLLIGGGIEHALLLKHWALNGHHSPANYLDIELIAEEPILLYPAMLSDLIAGHCTVRDCCIDLRHLCTAAGARYVEGRPISLSAETQTVTLNNGQIYRGDLISLDPYAFSDDSSDEPNFIQLSPNTHFYRSWQHVKNQRVDTITSDIAVIGCDEQAIELALALSQDSPKNTVLKIHLLYRGEHILPEQNFALQQKVRTELSRAGINLHPGFKIRTIDKRHSGLCIIAADRALSVNAAIGCQRTDVPPWLKHSGLPLSDKQGLISNEYGQAGHFNNIFILQEKAEMNSRWLAKNIQRQAQSTALKKRPARAPQKTIKSGHRSCLLSSLACCMNSKFLWRLQGFKQRRTVRRLNT